MGRETALRRRWHDLCDRCGIHDGSVRRQGSALVAAYRESHRHYHDLTHLDECLSLVDTMTDLGAQNAGVAELALWFHDAVYVPTATDNESRSAAMAVAWLDDAGYRRGAEVGRLVEMTAGHVLPGAVDAVAEAVHDADLAILGANAERYEEYSGQIRLEYGHLSDDEFSLGRRNVLESFLSTEQIYARSDIREAREHHARANMTRELEKLHL